MLVLNIRWSFHKICLTWVLGLCGMHPSSAVFFIFMNVLTLQGVMTGYPTFNKSLQIEVLQKYQIDVKPSLVKS